MQARLEFKEVVRVDGYGLIVIFSDNTMANYTVDELAHLRPKREQATQVKTQA